MDHKKVVLGLSGGVDSAASALMLREMGYTVCGLFLQGPGADPAPAIRAAQELGIELTVVDMAQELEEKVICPFVESYLKGETPNPCILCNPTVKFKHLIAEADRIGAQHIATGHYAEIRDGKLYASNSPKDQSYMLYRLPASWISRCIFPLGAIGDKSETREKAQKGGLSSGSAPDSMEICFIPSGDHGDFIESRGALPKRGNFVDETGKILGINEGIHRYTVGQRRGLGIAAEGRLYVRFIDAESGDVLLSLQAPLATAAILRDVVLTDPDYAGQAEISCKIRVRHSRRLDDGVFYPNENRITFANPVRALSPGQSAVCYTEAGQVIGGGYIARGQYK